ncbi:hypothetical protein ENBRE01_2499 [Enteropsectra breve]|nr:hypothetical protein ENBRE01_2499 [Enteropsectra breve]
MAKQAVPVKPKSLKEQKKELESRLFGEKNNAKKKEIQGLIKKIELAMKLDLDKKKEAETEKKSILIKQLIPVGVDPKSVTCLNFLNNNCDKGENCLFAHEIKKAVKPEEKEVEDKNTPKSICRFLIDAMNSGEYNKGWVCPLPKCKNIHKLMELGENSTVEVSLEEYIELQRQTLDESKGTPVTEEVFMRWRARKDKEEELHAKQVAALSNLPKGVDLFKERPEMFEDDEEAQDDVNYAERNYEDSDEDNKLKI